MKNKYEMSPNYILTLENEELRDRVMELTKQFNELKKKYENEFAEGVVQNKGIHEIVQERQVN
jgi:regulator of replication initiation timing